MRCQSFATRYFTVILALNSNTEGYPSFQTGKTMLLFLPQSANFSYLASLSSHFLTRINNYLGSYNPHCFALIGSARSL